MLGLPDAMTDWTKLYFLVEKRVSPRLEQLTRTAGFLDVVAVANGVSWMATRTVRDCGSSLVEQQDHAIEFAFTGSPGQRKPQGMK